MRKKIPTAFFLLSAFPLAVPAEVHNVSLQPAGWSAPQTQAVDSPIAKCDGAMRFADETQLGITLRDGDTLRLASPGALNMSALIRVADNCAFGVLRTFGKKHTRTYSAEDIHNGYLQTIPVSGDSLALVYSAQNGSEIEAASAFTGFVPLTPSEEPASFNKVKDSYKLYGTSKKCQVNVKSIAGTEVIRRAVCRLIINGKYLGSGTLVNNTSHDLDPLLLTSAHVINKPYNKLVSCVAYFNLIVEDPQHPSEPAEAEVINGADLLAFCATSDVALLRLSKTPSPAVRPWWCGWDRKPNLFGSFVCLHHPSGDAMKICGCEDIFRGIYTLGKTNEGTEFESNKHYQVARWEYGTTEGGSSGGGLFDGNLRLIGALTGGKANCEEPVEDYFWGLGLCWEQSSDDYGCLADFLDPRGTGQTAEDGTDATTTATPTHFGAAHVTAQAYGNALILNGPYAATAEIYDMEGHCVRGAGSGHTPRPDRYEINLPPGLYVVVVRSNGATYRQKVLVGGGK